MLGNRADRPAGGRYPGADPPAAVPVSELIREARQARGLTQEQLARRLAELAKDPYATRGLVARWERGHRIPGSYWREMLGRALDLSPERLERAAVSARLRRALTATSTPTSTTSTTSGDPAAPDARDAAAGP